MDGSSKPIPLTSTHEVPTAPLLDTTEYSNSNTLHPHDTNETMNASSTTLSSVGTPTKELEPKHPFSAFYCHPESSETISNAILAAPDADVERGQRSGIAMTNAEKRQSNRQSTKPCTMWPGQRDKRALRRTRTGWKRLDKRTRLWIKIAIGLVIVAVAVAIGVGISKAVGGGVWKGIDQQGPLDGGSGS
ncbi:MAG: hypothetical protein M4579_006125 [Chaenotheca gracillima]|nr:MAG: hypothetical protein M4579_006125 [Chaenotheca gracillima]